MRTIQWNLTGLACSMLLVATVSANPCTTQPPKQLGSGNWYQLVGGGAANATYAQAKAAAAAMTHNGLQGYLATITSAAENQFIARDLGQYLRAYIAGTDEAAEGMFRWDAGPENGQLFWNGAAVGYANWDPNSDPNHPDLKEYAEIYWFTGTWNDASGNFPQCYIVEYSIPEPAWGGLVGITYLIAAHTARRRRLA